MEWNCVVEKGKKWIFQNILKIGDGSVCLFTWLLNKLGSSHIEIAKFSQKNLHPIKLSTLTFSYWATLVNFLKSLVGAGFLSLPLAFRDAGLWVRREGWINPNNLITLYMLLTSFCRPHCCWLLCLLSWTAFAWCNWSNALSTNIESPKMGGIIQSLVKSILCICHHRLAIYYLNYGDLATHTCAHSFPWIRPFKHLAK